MQLRKLTSSEIHTIYKSSLFQQAFPPAEIRPWSSIQRHIAAGRYVCWGWFDEQGHVCSYAFLFAWQGALLLDYLASAPQVRGTGAGGAFLQALNARLDAPVVGEVEDLNSQSEAENALRRRRMDFYARNGFALRGVCSRVYGVHYRIVANAAAAGLSDEALAAYLDGMYTALLGSWRKRFHVRLWLAPVNAP